MKYLGLKLISSLTIQKLNPNEFVNIIPTPWLMFSHLTSEFVFLTVIQMEFLCEKIASGN